MSFNKAKRASRNVASLALTSLATAAALTLVVAVLAACSAAGPSTSPSPTMPTSPAASSGSSSSPSAAQLTQENAALKQALLGQLAGAAARQDGQQYHPQGSVSGHPQIVRLVRRYFAALLRGRAPAAAGARGRQSLAGFFRAGSPALARVRYYELGKLAASDGAPWPDGMATKSLITLHSLSVDRRGDRATVVVFPIHAYWVYVTDAGAVRSGEFDGQTDDAWNTTMWEGPHRLTLVRRNGTWSITDDFTAGIGWGDVAATLKAGGAPAAVWRAEARRIAARSAHTIPVPPGVTATFERFLQLLNEHDYRATDALFMGGHGYRAYMFSKPYASWHYSLRLITGFDPLSLIAVSSYPDVAFFVDASGPTYNNGGYDYAGGGMFGPSYWLARRASDGRWLIAPAATDEPFGAGGIGP